MSYLLGKRVLFSFFFFLQVDILHAASFIDPQLKEVYEKNAGACDFFVASDGKDSWEGDDMEYPYASIDCATNANCNPGINDGDTICLLAGRYKIHETIRPKKSVTLRSLGPPLSVILDGEDSTQIFNCLQRDITFHGIYFTNGEASSGAAVYGERKMVFFDCKFAFNHASIDGAAVMVSREAEFVNCTFVGNEAKYAGAVRVSDIGSASFESCRFYYNVAESKGGAVVTQIEDSHKNRVKFTNTIFCFNESPLGDHIFNFRGKS